MTLFNLAIANDITFTVIVARAGVHTHTYPPPPPQPYMGRFMRMVREKWMVLGVTESTVLYVCMANMVWRSKGGTA